MGHTAETKCLDCGFEYEESYGGGFTFHQLRCDRCGKEKMTGFDELGELLQRFLKGRPGYYGTTDAEMDANAPVEPISEKEYHKGVETFAGGCRCGGDYKLGAPPRCPKCRSTQLEEGQAGIMFD